MKITKKSIIYSAKIVKNGGVIIYPTDTAYALGADPHNKKAVARIYKIKGRFKSKPLPVIAASLSMVRRFFKLNNHELELVKKYWPGPLSLILEFRIKNYELRKLHSNILQNVGMTSLAVRVPDEPTARRLSKLLGGPIVSTSANISGAGECYSAQEVYQQFKNKKYQPDLILDGGKLLRRQPSTIIKVGKKGKILVLRKGPIKI